MLATPPPVFLKCRLGERKQKSLERPVRGGMSGRSSVSPKAKGNIQKRHLEYNVIAEEQTYFPERWTVTERVKES
jgi:hypothetical protein